MRGRQISKHLDHLKVVHQERDMIKWGLLGRSLRVQYGGKTGLDAAISAERCWSDLNGGTCLLN